MPDYNYGPNTSYFTPQQTSIDPRIISCDIEYSHGLNFNVEAIATIKMKVDPKSLGDLGCMTFISPNTFGTLLIEGKYLVLEKNNNKTILGEASDPESYKNIYMHYIDDLYTK